MSVSKVQRTGILVAQKIEKHLNATQRYAVRQRSTKLTPKSVGPLTTPDNLQLSKKLNWRNLMHFVELQIQSRLQPGLKAALQMPFSSSSVFYSVLKMPLRWEFLP